MIVVVYSVYDDNNGDLLAEHEILFADTDDRTRAEMEVSAFLLKSKPVPNVKIIIHDSYNVKDIKTE